MRAVVCTGYGPPDRLELREAGQPRPGDGDVLVPTHTRAHVRLVRELLASGDLRAVVDRTYALDDIVDAYHYVEWNGSSEPRSSP